jgi:hypothetical protein
LDKILQFHFLINIVRPRKRFNKWIKVDKIDELEVVKEYYGYSTEKAKQVLPLLNESVLDKMKKSLTRGGKNEY